VNSIVPQNPFIGLSGTSASTMSPMNPLKLSLADFPRDEDHSSPSLKKNVCHTQAI